MRTAHWPTECASVASRYQYQLEGTQVNKFEQVSDIGHEMSVPWGTKGPCTMRSHVQGGGSRAWGSLCGEVQCIMGNDHMLHPPHMLQNERQTRLKTLPFATSLAGGKKIGEYT